MRADRELLELAAKAAGHQFDSTEPFEIFVPDNSFGNNWCEWNPLDDDGDALRLGVKLGLSVRVDEEAEIVWVYRRNSYLWRAMWTTEAGRYSAAREAIVNAAASIGRLMP